MVPFSHSLRLAAALSLFALTACAGPTGKLLIGDPENPYPLASPKVGDIVHMPTGTAVNLTQMLDMAGNARVVYVGETHDNPASHSLELETLKGLEERHPGKVALGMEMFTRSQQPVLDRWVAGELDEKNFVRTSKWFDNWKMDFDYYRELLIFARDKHIPVIALNAEKSLVQAVRNKPLQELSAEEKAQLPEFDQSDPYQRGMVEAMFGGHSQGKMHIEGFLRAQTLWDETMAESAARFLKSPEGKDRHLVVIAGGNHIGYGFGIPRRVFRRFPASYVVIGGTELVVSEKKTEKPEMMSVNLPVFPMVPYDFLAYISYEALPKQEIYLGVMFEPTPTKRGLLVKSVVADSNAFRAGVKDGDILLSLDSQPLSDSFDLVYPIKQKHPGDHSTLQIERQGKPLQLEITFQTGELKHPGQP